MEDLKYLKTEIENLKKIRMEEPNEWRVEGGEKKSNDMEEFRQEI